MAILGSSVAALQLLRRFTCPHCGAEQNRVLPSIGSSLKCHNCLQGFSPDEGSQQERKTGKRRR
jgi:hypothetical protein